MSQIDFDYFENVIIYKSLTDSSYLGKIIEHVKIEYFKNTQIARIFGLIQNFYQKRNKLPTVTELKTYLTTDELRNAFKVVAKTFSDIDKNLDPVELLENTEKFVKEKAIYQTIMGLTDLGTGQIDTADLLNRFEKVCNINFDTDFGLDLFRDREKIIDDLNNSDTYISTGWDWVDKNLGGGLLEKGKALYVIAGETNIGKSIILGNIAANLVDQGKTVLLITLEMSEMLYARRICSNITRIPLRDLKTEQQSLRQILKAEEDKGGRLLLKEFPPSTLTPSALKSFCLDIIASGVKIDAIVLDYLNLMHSTVGNGSYERIKFITEQVRALSYFCLCPIVTATQLNRSGFGGKNPGLDTISESIGLAATADVIITAFQSEEDRELNIIRFGLGKNRYGPKGMVYTMRINYNTLTITDEGDGLESELDDAEMGSLEMFSV